ncbi:hypothetical protein DFH07DRAFT_737847, partial [Mycena maculata]
GNFIFQNYRQALEKIGMNRGQLDVLEQRLGTTAADYEADLIKEQNYFKGLRSEPSEVLQTVKYMELLMKLHMRTDIHFKLILSPILTWVSEQAEAAKVDFHALDQNIIYNGYKAADIVRIRTQYRTTFTRFLATQEEVCRFEEAHKIADRWLPTSKEYQDALLLMSECRYKVAVTGLERLVVQRLFEMTKLGMSGIGYKMREKLRKALKTRAEAIRKALERYNAAAIALNPPHPQLTWQAIVNGASLAEFDWLWETREDIREQPWAQPARRQAMTLHFGIK